MASDILQNKTYSHSYYTVANIWHLLVVPKLPFFPPHMAHIVLPNPTGCPFPLPQVHRHGRTQGFKHSLGICFDSGLLLAGKRCLKGYYCWIYYNGVGCMRFCAGFFALTEMLTQIPFWFSYQQLLSAASQDFFFDGAIFYPHWNAV